MKLEAIRIMRLMPMIDFVLERSLYWKNLCIKGIMSESKCRHSHSYECINYAEFLKQPPKRGMFFPCDENGFQMESVEDVKEEYEVFHPNHVLPFETKGSHTLGSYVNHYKSAKKKILFEDFDPDMVDFYLGHKSVEALIGLGEFKLTDNAIKQIGL